AARVHADGQGVARSAFRGRRARRQAGTVQSLVDERLEEGGYALGVGILQSDRLQHAAFERRLDVQLLEQALDQLVVFLARRDDERVVERVGLNIDLFRRQRGLAGQSLRFETGG